MNTYKKFAPKVFVARCPKQHEKGSMIIVTTKRGKENEHIVHNFLGMDDDQYLYSITRADGYYTQEHYRRKAERYDAWAGAREIKGEEWQKKSNEGHEFLRLAEPIKIGHHSEKRHRALIERNHRRMDNAMENYKAAEAHSEKAERYARMAENIDLSMPESLSYYEKKLEQAIDYHEGLKSGKYERPHSMAVQYANRDRKNMEKRVEIAKKLWG